ncbi:diaminopimelate decarboxylase [Buchnera aphidicola]|uniref:diaminopimelate decarboxylase n=1 Tax=Buchnera aphidicola TaxID=9 RepID=UPI0030ECC2A8
MSNIKNLKKFVNLEKIKILEKKYKLPLWLYDFNTIKKKIKKLKIFDIVRFAQKSCSNLTILKLIKKLKVKIDAVSQGEIERAILSGFKKNSNDIIFTADLIDEETLHTVIKNKIPVNAGSLIMLKNIGKNSKKHKVWLRINPKFGDGHSKKTNTGGEHSKHGIWNIKDAIKIIKKYQLKLLGLHIHIGSGAHEKNLKKSCFIMIKEALRLNKKIKYISAGGGLPIPYHFSEKKINIKNYYKKWDKTRKILSKHFNKKIKLEIEPGRFIVAESGILIAKVYVIKKNEFTTFVLINAGFNDLIRPAFYGSYHQISIIPFDSRKLNYKNTFKTVIGGPLCESGDIFNPMKNDKIKIFKLPEIKVGDYIIFHDTGAYGSAMSSNYNSRPLIAEILIKNKKFKQIRRRQTNKEMFSLEL